MILSTTWDYPGIVKYLRSILNPSSIGALLKLIFLMYSSLIWQASLSWSPIKAPIFTKDSFLKFWWRNYAITFGSSMINFSLINFLITLVGFYEVLNLSMLNFKRFIFYFFFCTWDTWSLLMILSRSWVDLRNSWATSKANFLLGISYGGGKLIPVGIGTPE